MKMRCSKLLAATLALCGGAAWADATPRYESAIISYALDTVTEAPRSVKTAADLAATVPVRKGETVTATAPDGTVTAVVSGAATDMALALSETLDAGGLWTLVNSREGSATFTVRHSLCGTLGEGTDASPAKLVDGDELVDYGAGDGYVFTLEGGNTLLAALKLPTEVRLAESANGAWSLIAAANGLRYEWGELVYPIDSAQPGPDRRIMRREALPIAYTGDNWLGNATSASTLTITSPSGSAIVNNLEGSGANPFAFNAPGDWTVRLAIADGRTLTSVVTVRDAAFMMIIR